jgi:hypothetical protein
MTHELKHPLQTRGRGLPDRGADNFQTIKLLVHKTSEKTCLVSLVVTDAYGNKCKDTRLGECWILSHDEVGRRYPPYRLLVIALEQLLAQTGARLLPETTDTPA